MKTFLTILYSVNSLVVLADFVLSSQLYIEGERSVAMLLAGFIVIIYNYICIYRLWFNKKYKNLDSIEFISHDKIIAFSLPLIFASFFLDIYIFVLWWK